ncbi:MAG: exosortase/archaeosortase family protein [Candidatus Auribacterota bacterium]|nr:exosortase/archaeosortase family protein [Candidatus Auribacterota bacterium]
MEKTGLSFNWKSILSRTLLISVVLVLFLPTFFWMHERFFEEHSYYTHGWLIPLAIAFLLYQRREIIARERPQPSWFGLPVLAGGLSLHIFAQFFGINFLSGVALPVVVFGLILMQWGWPRSRYIIGPFLLSVFMIPLPGIWIITIAFHLKLYSAGIGVALVRLLGITIIPNGIEIVLPTAPPGEILTIGDPCSGLRSLLSFGALGAFFALLLPLSVSRRGIVFLTAILLAPFSNILRVVSLIILRQTVGPGILSGPWHIMLGVLIFFLCFIVLLQVIRWLLR